jgi:Zn-dependent protease
MEVFLIVTVLWVFSVCIHEFGHAVVAYYGGDHTVVEKGYLTLNPIHYTHPVMSILMPVVFMILGGIGLPGGAVYIERDLLRSRGWDTAVSLAGPAANLILVVIITACFRFGFVASDPESVGSVSLAFLLELQICSVVLNLIPIPPLDGFQALAPWMPADRREHMYSIASYTQWILFLALWYVEPVRDLFWGFIFQVMYWLGVDPSIAYAGFKAFRFWAQ